MDVGITLRNMGPQSAPEIMRAGAAAAERAGLESVWIVDHIAIPPDDAEGSGGRYVDPLVTLGWLAGCTARIKLGVGVLVLPYRPPLPTAKQIAAVQELSGGRLLVGAGVGWMDAEFNALGVDRRRRGRITDETLAVINACFAADEVVVNGERVLFKPRPPKPPIYVGGRGPHAWSRAAKYADGWLPMSGNPEKLARDIDAYRTVCSEAGRPSGQVTAMGALPLDDPTAAAERLSEYARAGVDRLVCGVRYDTADEYADAVERLRAIID